MGNLLNRLIPFIFLGIMLVLLVAGIILFSYLLIFGALVGVVLFIVAWLKQAFFPSKQITKTKKTPRTFDHK